MREAATQSRGPSQAGDVNSTIDSSSAKSPWPMSKAVPTTDADRRLEAKLDKLLESLGDLKAEKKQDEDDD